MVCLPILVRVRVRDGNNKTKDFVLYLKTKYNFGSPHFIFIKSGFGALPHNKVRVFHALPNQCLVFIYIITLYWLFCFMYYQHEHQHQQRIVG